jgi:hypothetical protein
MPHWPTYNQQMLTVGSEGLYEWLVTDQQFDLLQISPEVVLGKYIAVTSIDSAPASTYRRRDGGRLGESQKDCVQPQN